VHGDFGEVGEGFVFEEMANLVAGGVIEDQAESTFVSGVTGEQDHGSIEETIAERGIGKDQGAFELDLRIGHVCNKGSPELAAGKEIFGVGQAFLFEITGREGL